MRITELLDLRSINLNLKKGSKPEVIEMMVDLMDQSGSLSNRETYLKDVLARESESTTGVGMGVAIPHGKSAGVKQAAIAAAVNREGIDFDSLDGESAKLFFMLAAPAGSNNEHLSALAKLSGLLMDDEFREQLLNAKTPEEFIRLIDRQEGAIIKEEPVTGKKLLAVTACPTGIAHTFMAAEALAKAAAGKGIQIKVETNGSEGVKNKLTLSEIEECEAIIVAADKKVDMARFNGKKVIQVSVANGIHKAEELVDRALSREAAIYYSNETSAVHSSADEKESAGRLIYKHLMSGVSHMIPFVVGGGILIALAFLFDDYAIDPSSFGSNTELAAFFMNIGGMAFGFMLPVLAGFIAYSIADRPGIAIGFVGGMLANNGDSGFLGALFAGFLAGYLVLGMRKAFQGLPQALEGIKPVLLYPLIGIFLMGLIMTFIVNPPVAALDLGIQSFLQNLQGINSILLGILVGGMMAIDMGGPINKAAYVTGVAALASGNYSIMAAVMAGGMVPPLVTAIAATFFKNKFTKDERKAAPVNYVMGLSFITEGAIPFAAADPLRVIPSCVVGSAIAGALSMAFGATLMAPHGGIFVLPTIGNWLMYLISIIIGSIVGALMLGMLKKPIAE